MRIRVYFLLLCLFTNISAIGSTVVQDNFQFQPGKYSYVIIGAFVFQKNAKSYTNYAIKRKMAAKYAWNPYRNLYYVYTFYHEDKQTAIEEVYKVRENFKIQDAWVYSGQLNGLEGTKIQPELTYGERAVNPPKEKPTYTYIAPEGETQQSTPEELERQSLQREMSGSVETPVLDEPEVVITEERPIQNEELLTDEERPYGIVRPSEAEEPIILEDFKIYINAVNSEQLTEVAGPVEMFDHVRNRKLKDTETHTLFGLNDPKNGTGAVKATSRIFGYRPKEILFNINSPASDTTGYIYTVGDSIVMDMPLDRLQKGDIAVMWNVLFYKDAAVMRPESKAELNSLLEMLKENPDMKVMLHGHTNGNSTGSITYIGENDVNFFSLNGDHASTKGSAKKLSEYRAVTIQKWLNFNGIDLSRMTVKGWGGDRMLHGKHDPKAYENVRVEVEIIEDGRN